MYSEGVFAKNKAERTRVSRRLKEKGLVSPILSPIALFHNLKVIDTGNQCDAGLFEVNLPGGVYEAHCEDFSFEPLCLPVHSAGRVGGGRLFNALSVNELRRIGVL